MRTGGALSGGDLEGLPWWKNPWGWAVIIGLLIITLTRPCTRHIPDPPRELSELPLIVAIDQTGLEWDSRHLSNQVHIVSFHRADCGERCEVAWKRMDIVYNKVRRMRSRARLLTFVLDEATDVRERIVAHDVEPNLWRIVDVAGSAHGVFRGEIVASFHRWRSSSEAPAAVSEDPARWGAITIVDRGHRIRGFFDPAKGDSAHELFHRAERLFSTPPKVVFSRE